MKILFLLIFVSTICFGQTRVKSLIVIETHSDKDGDEYKNLVSYNFKKGNFISKDILYTAYQDKKIKYGRWFYFRYNSFIYKNRYAIGDGSVYDLKTNTLMLDSVHNFVRVSADSVFFYQDNRKELGLWALDLKTTKYVLLNRHKRNLDERRSPDYKHYILDDYSTTNIKLVKAADSSFTLIPAAGAYYARYTRKKTETHWLDNESFLYANHTNTFPPLPKPVPKPTTDTVKVYDFITRDDASTKVTIFKYNIKKKSSEKIAELDSVTHSYRRGLFNIDGKNQLIYTSTNGTSYRLNLKNRKFTPYLYTVLQHGFSIEIKKNSIERALKYKGVEIGQVKSYINNYTSDKFFVSADYGKLWVWNAYTRGARSFTLPYEFQIVGWVDNLFP